MHTVRVREQEQAREHKGQQTPDVIRSVAWIPQIRAGEDGKGQEVRFVPVEHADAIGFARTHLEQVKDPIHLALAVLALRGEDIAQDVRQLKEWLDNEAESLGKKDAGGTR